MALSRNLGVAIIGCGEVAQTIHLPTLSLLSHLYTVHVACDVLLSLAEHCAKKFKIEKATTRVEDAWEDSRVNVVYVLCSDDSHESVARGALEGGKHVRIASTTIFSATHCVRFILLFTAVYMYLL